ncbi:hypothetical protein CMI47_05055 [Candidatus Pacearchaeota archaeon]|nr:hypothetical protein [Candidatus Pacearchaeota archaeon]
MLAGSPEWDRPALLEKALSDSLAFLDGLQEVVRQETEAQVAPAAWDGQDKQAALLTKGRRPLRHNEHSFSVHVPSLFSFGTVVNMPDRVRSICAKTPVPHRDKPLARIYNFGGAA